MTTLSNVLLLLALIAWLLDREDDVPRRTRVLPFRPRTAGRDPRAAARGGRRKPLRRTAP